MLRLITGRAGAGKTAQIMDEIRRAASKHEGGRCLLVPEQYSGRLGPATLSLIHI